MCKVKPKIDCTKPSGVGRQGGPKLKIGSKLTAVRILSTGGTGKAQLAPISSLCR
jgi:hypothetical protein